MRRGATILALVATISVACSGWPTPGGSPDSAATMGSAPPNENTDGSIAQDGAATPAVWSFSATIGAETVSYSCPSLGRTLSAAAFSTPGARLDSNACNRLPPSTPHDEYTMTVAFRNFPLTTGLTPMTFDLSTPSACDQVSVTFDITRYSGIAGQDRSARYVFGWDFPDRPGCSATSETELVTNCEQPPLDASLLGNILGGGPPCSAPAAGPTATNASGTLTVNAFRPIAGPERWYIDATFDAIELPGESVDSTEFPREISGLSGTMRSSR